MQIYQINQVLSVSRCTYGIECVLRTTQNIHERSPFAANELLIWLLISHNQPEHCGFISLSFLILSDISPILSCSFSFLIVEGSACSWVSSSGTVFKFFFQLFQLGGIFLFAKTGEIIRCSALSFSEGEGFCFFRGYCRRQFWRPTNRLSIIPCRVLFCLSNFPQVLLSPLPHLFFQLQFRLYFFKSWKSFYSIIFFFLINQWFCVPFCFSPVEISGAKIIFRLSVQSRAAYSVHPYSPEFGFLR